jgi:decaprenylphospho-beta-D-ribofuranose 2-oxidase
VGDLRGRDRRHRHGDVTAPTGVAQRAAGTVPETGQDDRVSERLLSGWGRTAPTRASVLEPAGPGDVRALIDGAGERGVIARGLGRAYGDAAQNAGGRVIDTTALDRVRAIDVESGVATVEAGVSLDHLTDLLLPLGWFVPVTPGTCFVTIGGAIASDVHGKNHHRDGSFCEHVLSIVLETPAGERLTLTPRETPDEFWATAGGMGLTGVVVEATVQLMRVESASVVEDVERASDLDDVMARMEARDHEYRYSVAWIDCLARGRRLGRSVLLRGDHASAEQAAAGGARGPSGRSARSRALSRRRGLPLAAPPWVPNGLLRKQTIAAFNEAYFRHAPREERGRLVSLDSFFYPLDSVRGWNRMYGSRGFLQYQFVVPHGREDALRSALERLSGAGVPSFLAVLKRFRDQPGLISFPMAGWTLALDMPAALPGLGPLLDSLDELVAEAGGRVYLSKDSRLRPDLLETMYPQLPRWREVQARLDPQSVMRSDLSRRLGLVG